MKSFFKYFFASILGVMVAMLLLFFIMAGIGGAMMSAGDKATEVKENSILTINFAKTIVDRASNNPFGSFDFAAMQPDQTLGLNKILKAIENAKTDPKIKGIYIEQFGFGGGAATLEEVRNALIDFKTSGKFIVCYGDVYTQKTYYLASIADRIYLNPEGAVEWSGMRSEIMFYKNALEKLGVEPQIIRHGKFKSAIEPFILEKMSPENREQTITYVGSIWNHWVKGISETRNISVEDLNMIADKMLINGAQSTVDYKFVDALLYKDQIIDTLKMLTGTKADKDQPAVSLADYFKAPSNTKKKFSKDKIAVVYAQGSIIMGEGSDAEIGSEGTSKAIRKARRDSTVKAIVFRINSGGGSALASEVIWREVELANKVKPVIVSMGDVAASGGYYIAAPATAILASPTTITGSIGVFGMYMNVQKLMEKKLGVNVDVAKTNEHADFGSTNRPMTAEERAVAQKGVEDIYSTFIGHVSQGRGITTAQVDEIGQGRVWSGVNAMDIKLIDKFGGLNDAIALAAEKAGLTDYRLTELPVQKSPFEEMMKSVGTASIKNELGLAFKHYNHIMGLVKNQGIQARLPYEIELY